MARRAGAEYTVKRKMADGSIKEYRYARSGAKRTPARPDSIVALIAAYRASPQWKALKPRTKDHYARYTAMWDIADDVPLVEWKRNNILTRRHRVRQRPSGYQDEMDTLANADARKATRRAA